MKIEDLARTLREIHNDPIKSYLNDLYNGHDLVVASKYRRFIYYNPGVKKSKYDSEKQDFVFLE